MKTLILPLLALLFLISCEKETMTDLQTNQEHYENGSITFRSPAPNIDVCHYDAENNTWHIINISENAWPAHEGHGDVQLIDEDGDGYVTSANECGLPVDCDDTDAELTDNCSTICEEGELEVTIDPDGEPGSGDEYTLYVHPNDQNSGFPQSDGIQWGGNRTDIPDLTNYMSSALALGDFDGKANTDKIYTELTTNQGVSYSYAAKRCKELSTETGCDWYLPALGELKAIYDEYGNTEAKRTENNFDGFYYWSSTELTGFFAWWQYFDDGVQVNVNKNNFGSCRCVRR